jgi:hypothetical protein
VRLPEPSQHLIEPSHQARLPQRQHETDLLVRARIRLRVAQPLHEHPVQGRAQRRQDAVVGFGQLPPAYVHPVLIRDVLLASVRIIEHEQIGATCS